MQSKKALVVGIDKYKTHPLRNCVNDARELASMISMPEFGFTVQSLIDENATRRNLITGLTSLFGDKPQFALFYFAGHGRTTDLGTFILSVDTDDVEIGIDLEWIRRLVQRTDIEDSSVLIILDCCHSGSANVRGIPAGFARNISRSDIESIFSGIGTGKVLLAACKPDELAYEEPSLQHGVFTYFLLDGLLGDAANEEGEITVLRLFDYISSRFNTRTGQSPVFKGDIIGNLVLGKGLTPRESIDMPEDKAREVEVRATQQMNEYIQSTSTDIETWRRKTYRDASIRLKPIINWMEKQIKMYPKLVSRPGFKSAYSNAQAKLSDLAHLEDGLLTRDGVVINRIGSGTFGAVWKLKAEDGRSLAYKVYHPIDLDNHDKLARFNRGYRAMEQLDHPHIVKVHSFTDCPVGFLMDFIDGQNLRDYAAEKRSIAGIVAQLLTVGETLKHTHSRNVIHRDVKPENLIMRWDADTDLFRPYLTDFDLAWFSMATKFTREGFGSLVYAAPEQLAQPNSHSAHAPTTDIYSFGQLCFFFICRRDPVILLADNAFALGEELRHWTFEEPARKLVELYKECTHQEPKKRIQDFREVCDRLFEISALIEQTDHKKLLDLKAFAKQLAFSIVGMAPERIRSDMSFLTASGRTLVEIGEMKTRNADGISFRFESQVPLTVEGASSFREARDRINERINEVIKPHPTIFRRSGNQGLYESFVNFKDISLNMDGVEMCRSILMRIIDVIERS